MLLTITNDSPPATDLGFLLHKHPAAMRSVELGFGVAHAFYPVAGEQSATIALLCEVDPVGLVRRSRGGPFPLAPYVNDRPYAASSLLSVALRKMFGTALSGRCEQRPDLVDASLELAARVPVLPCRGGQELVRRLFEPLGYQVSAQPVPLDPAFPGWGGSPYADVTIRARCRLRDLLRHLYVLLPVLDDAKHYWVTREEIGKLLEVAGEWLATHPERQVIVARYLRHQRGLADEALARLLAGDGSSGGADADDDTEAGGSAQAAGSAQAGGSSAEGRGAGRGERARLRQLRVAAVTRVLLASGARRVLDLGCGDGQLLTALLASSQFEEVTGVDAAVTALERAARRLRLDELAPRQRERVRLLQGALTYRDRRLAGYDAAVLMEVVEHVDPSRLGALEQSVFGEAAPATVIVTTPNAEYNRCYPGLAAGGMRHPDHRFEWDRAGFRAWAQSVAARYGYTAAIEPVGEPDPQAGPPTQLAVLRR